jgi:hypothetical protein
MNLNRINKQRGQGMVGFLVACVFVLVPLSVGMNYLSKVGDARHKSQEAARYATWERTVWHQSNSSYNRKPDIDISREINQRVFSEQDKALDSTQDKRSVAANTITLDSNLYAWRDRERMLEPPTNSRELNNLRIGDRRAPGNFSSVINRVATTMFGLDRNGFYNSNIQLNLFDKRDFFQNPNINLGNVDLSITSNNAMLVGAWNANGPSGIRSSVQRTVPTSYLNTSAFRTIRNMASRVGFKEIGRFEPGKVETEWIPCQRATGGNRSKRCS